MMTDNVGGIISNHPQILGDNDDWTLLGSEGAEEEARDQRKRGQTGTPTSGAVAPTGPSNSNLTTLIHCAHEFYQSVS